jgi:hypothetical protein
MIRLASRSALGVGFLAAGFALALSSPSRAISRTETIIRAKAFAFHPWTATSANGTASCSGAYKSIYKPGDYMGLPYDWGGYMTLFTFDQQIAQGYGAGSYPADGILDCTSGLDCSGFVSQAWQSGHYTTSDMAQISTAISASAVLPGDVFNDAGNHVAMWSHNLANGEPVFYESVFYNVHLSMPGWSWVNGYIPRRYQNITGTTVTDPAGTVANPIVVGSFPYTDSRNTAQSPSDLLDGCGADPSIKESGPEYVYQVTFTQPGKLTVSVQDDAGVDIDVHLYTSMNTNDCIARNDTTFTQNVDCGTYYVVADTFANSGGSLPGPYTLNMTFQPSTGQACGSGPKKYSFKGGMGEPCAYPGNQSLGFCNPNLGADTCLYTNTTSFCTKPCATNADCSALNGGCCSDIGNNEKYCVIASLCGGSGTPDSGVAPKPDSGDPVDAGFGGAAGSGFGGSGNGTGLGGNAGTPGFGGGSNVGGNPAFGGNGAGAGTGNPASGSGDSSGCSLAGPGGSRIPGSPAALLLGLLGLAALRRRSSH